MKNVLRFKIRSLQWNDFDDYCRIERSLQEELNKNPRLTMGRYRKKVDWNYLITSFSEIYKGIKTGSVKALALEVNEHVVGLSLIRRATESPNAQHMGDLTYYIIKQYRNKGMGTKLVKENLNDTPKGCEIICAGTHSNNKASIALLKTFGFKRASFMPRFSKRGKIYLNVEEFYKRIR